MNSSPVALLSRLLGRAALAVCALSAWTAASAQAEPGALGPVLVQELQQLALSGTRAAAPDVRFEVSVGRIDPRLRLAPCERIETLLPPGTRLWGQTRLALRCTQGPVAWNVMVPVTIKAYGQALVATAAVPVGATLGRADLTQAEVDLAEVSSVAMTDVNALVGRTLARPLLPGQSVRQSHLKPRIWFAAGETVSVLASGAGFSVTGEGQALTPGVEGQVVRVRTESGRVLTGQPVAERRVEIAL